MVTTVSEAIERLEQGASARVVGDPGGMFAIIIQFDDQVDTIANDQGVGPRYYPSLNHAADWLRRHGVLRFKVDVSNWKKPDTGRSRSAARP